MNPELGNHGSLTKEKMFQERHSIVECNQPKQESKIRGDFLAEESACTKGLEARTIITCSGNWKQTMAGLGGGRVVRKQSL